MFSELARYAELDNMYASARPQKLFITRAESAFGAEPFVLAEPTAPDFRIGQDGV
jgi:hypothetical protein